MAAACDHTSVGIVVWKDEKLLLIERAKFPFGYAIPAGHVDGDASFEVAARRELREEVGLEAEELRLLAEARKHNICRREGGTWHQWKIYEAQVHGEMVRSEDETKRVGWYSREEMHALAVRTEAYLAGTISGEEWEMNSGLEPIMYEWFKELHII